MRNKQSPQLSSTHTGITKKTISGLQKPRQHFSNLGYIGEVQWVGYCIKSTAKYTTNLLNLTEVVSMGMPLLLLTSQKLNNNRISNTNNRSILMLIILSFISAACLCYA